ncbi:MAG: UxaA family hydrolase [Candidatus Acidiferrales bacterium]
MESKVLRLDPKDNVRIALTALREGEEVSCAGEAFVIASGIPAKHKFAACDLALASPVMMYGIVVGRTTEAVGRGELLTTRNVRHEATDFQARPSVFHWSSPNVSGWRDRTFHGYRRSDGQVGTRNHWLVVPLVFCENRNIGVLKQALEEELGLAPPQIYRSQVARLRDWYREGMSHSLDEREPSAHVSDAPPDRLFENIDGIKFLTHEGGCGGTREDTNNLCGLIADYLHHPNVAGGTVLSLGCQHSQVQILREQIRARNPKFDKPLLVFEQQKSQSESSMLSLAIRKTFLGLIEANRARREPVPLSDLCLGLKCGGSDGFSGISANPAIGHTADLIAAVGGRSILAEFPELCGVEQELIDRSTSPEVAERFMSLMREYASRARAVRSSFDMNPSPGNIRDGLLTDAMKSAGAVKKGGTSPVTAVLDYPEYSKTAGLNLLCTPGSDVECVTAQVGAGANVVLFTTGLGTPTGNPIAPVLKISSNSELAKRMNDIIDLDAGPIVTGETTIERMGEEILERVLQVASGESRTKAEELGQDDFIPWKRGVSL